MTKLNKLIDKSSRPKQMTVSKVNAYPKSSWRNSLIYKFILSVIVIYLCACIYTNISYRLGGFTAHNMLVFICFFLFWGIFFSILFNLKSIFLFIKKVCLFIVQKIFADKNIYTHRIFFLLSSAAVLYMYPILLNKILILCLIFFILCLHLRKKYGTKNTRSILYYNLITSFLMPIIVALISQILIKFMNSLDILGFYLLIRIISLTVFASSSICGFLISIMPYSTKDIKLSWFKKSFFIIGCYLVIFGTYSLLSIDL